MKPSISRSARGRTLSLLLIAAHLSACATMFSGRTEQVSIATDPPGALVTIDNGQTYHGTQALDLQRSEAHVVRVEQPGFEPQSAVVEQHLNGLFWLNFLWGCAFPIGMIVDCSTGAMWNLKPDDVHVTLKPTRAP